jgi:hypothetical protein
MVSSLCLPDFVMSFRKRSLDEHDELDDRHDAKRQAFDASVLSSPPSSSAQKRRLDEDDEVWPDAKRKALEAPILPTSPPSVSTRKRPLEVDDTGQPNAKRPAPLLNESRTAPFNQKDRMELYIHLRACRTWESYCRVLNAIPKTDEFTIALALNDSAEWARLRALSQLDARLYSRIIKNVSEIQMDKDRFDPKSLFPCVATKNFMETLHLLHASATFAVSIFRKVLILFGRSARTTPCTMNVLRRALTA